MDNKTYQNISEKNLKELWVPVVGFEKYYEVSNLGRVRSKDRLAKNSRGNSYRLWKGRVLSLNLKNNKKYINCKMSVNGKTYTKQLHWIVLASFKTKPSAEKWEVNHIDGNKRNNKLKNLEWVTSKQNQIHAIENQLYKPAKRSKNGKSKLNEKIVFLIKKDLLKNMKNIDISNKYNISLKMVSDIKTKRTWKHVGVANGK